ncbi:GFA family protein [Seohaeicola zhoushanensis]|uniref:Aldehyde-activating protein n=1 Tax=Seohaeicola zhoushanensis TaxID=1569283 RepID=A0A8J3GXN1_9RHOB|nr:GFA family protein [Seohaeicola zhoushanensis]GHF54499.1 aldehyde-activating protein [Seohaeicola zhoushanensis]
MTDLHGECLCGAVAYQVPDRFAYALNCHCSQCRRATGAAFKPFAGIPLADLRITRGAHKLTSWGDDQGQDRRCGTCGSLLWSVVRDGAWAHVTMGTLMDTPSIRPTAHIFTGSKAPWHEITDDLPQFPEFPG